MDYFAASVLSKTGRAGGKKHVQFPDEQSCIEEATEIPPREMDDEKSGKKINNENSNTISHYFIHFRKLFRFILYFRYTFAFETFYMKVKRSYLHASCSSIFI